MSIDGIPQGNNPIPKMEKMDIQAAPPKKVKVTPHTSGKSGPIHARPPALPHTGSTGAKSAQPIVNTEAASQAAAQSLVELQTATDKLRQSNHAFHTRSQISELGRSIVETKDSLHQAAQERMEAIVQASGESSFFNSMGIMEKAQHINRLKDDIKNMEIERGALVGDLREKVMSNQYDPGGMDILQGMLEEYL
ncbi:hypothetical protein K8S19_07165 [bacterium]|nr:hypothetical protein [bacterium]